MSKNNPCELCRLRCENMLLRQRIKIVAGMAKSWGNEFPSTSQGRYAAIHAALTSGSPDLVNESDCDCGGKQ